MNSQRVSQGMSREGNRAMRRDRRHFLMMAGSAGAAYLAAACGGSTSKPAPTATTAATIPSSAATAAAKAATAPSTASAALSSATSTSAAARTTPAGPVSVSTVTYISGDTAPPELDFYKKFNADFQTAFPQYRAEGSNYSAADIYPKLQTALATNSPPSMLFKDGKGETSASLWDQGLLAPVNDVMEDLYKLVGGKDKFDPAAIARFTAPTGEIYGIPTWGAPRVWWYRTDLLQQAGLTPPAGHWDWNFLLQAVKATHKPPQVYGVAQALGRNASVLLFIGALILSNGGHFLSPDLKDVVFDSPEVRESIDLIKELSVYTPPDATTWTSLEQLNAIVQGTVAMGQYGGRPFGDFVSKNPAISVSTPTPSPRTTRVRSPALTA